MGRDMMEPAFSTRQMNKYADMLSLTKEQKAAVTALLDGYTEETRAASEKMRTKLDDMRSELRDSQDPAMFTKMQDQVKVFRDARKKLDDGFTSDVKAVLTPKQLEVWPTIERTQRREVSVRRGFISGERVDLVSLVEEVKPADDAKAALKPILEQYEQDLDRELVKRNELQEKSMDKVGELMRTGDTDAAQKLIKEGREASVKVRDVNRNFAKQIAAALPDDKRTTFNDSFKRASFPTVYGTTQTTTALKSAAGFTDLKPDQKDAIAKLSENYGRSLTTVNEKLATAQEDGEMKFDVTNMMNRFRGGGGGGGGQDNPQRDLRREKQDLDRTTLESLKKILTEEQAAKLPKPEQNGRGSGGQGADRNGQTRRGGRRQRAGGNQTT
jgi:Spy/CpxP family protein refolding chaperone